MRSIIILITSLMLFSPAYPYGRSGALADPSFLTTGDNAVCFSVAVDTSTPVLVYDSNSTGKWDREILIQNFSSTYEIMCGTHSGVSFSSGPRFLLPLNPTAFSTNGRYDIWCILNPDAGSSSVEVGGVIEWDSKD